MLFGKDSYGTGPGSYAGYGNSQHATGWDANLSSLPNSGTVNSISMPYTGTPREVGEKLLRDGNVAAFKQLVKDYGF